MAKRAAPLTAGGSPAAAAIFDKLDGQHPGAWTELAFTNAYELLVATILSAQCTDARVNQVTPALFVRYPTPAALARATQEELEPQIQPTGFFRMKSKSLRTMAEAVVDQHGGQVPNTMEELVKLPGVGRKTANVILGTWFKKNEGVVVDTHVHRLTRLLKLTRQDDPVKIEQDLMEIVPRDDWTWFSHTLILHGRSVCIARRPRCADCVINRLCPSSLV